MIVRVNVRDLIFCRRTECEQSIDLKIDDATSGMRRLDMESLRFGERTMIKLAEIRQPNRPGHVK